MSQAVSGKVIPVRVAVRCRPLIPKEVDEGCQTCLQFVKNEPQVILGSNKQFSYDYVFDPQTPQDQVYDEAVKSLLNGIFDGYNATVLAYGQTGSGKTYSMGGGYGVCMDTADDILGVIPRVVRELFAKIDSLTDHECTVKVSYLEIYNEELLDLLVSPAAREKSTVTIREDATGIMLKGLTEREVRSVEDTMGCLESGSHSRTVGCTAMNNSSSRSHAIFTIHIDKASRTDEQDVCKTKFHLVDLAGSERQKKTRAEGDRFKEGVNINKGLLALGNVISALGDDAQRQKHVPYRDSKLTRLLQDSLGGNSLTVMIACVSPADSNMEETLSTLRYADRARKIKNKPIVNRDPQAAEIIRLRQVVQDLRMQLVEMGKPMDDIMKGSSPRTEPTTPVPNADQTAKIKRLEKEIEELKAENSQLQDQLHEAVDANVAQAGKVIRLEICVEEYKEKLEQLQEIRHQLSALDASTADDNDVNNKTKVLIHELSQKLQEVEQEHSMPLLDDSSIVDEDNEAMETCNISGGAGDNDESEEKKRQTEHRQRRQKLHQDLNNLNQMLEVKESLVNKMKASDQNMEAIKKEYEDSLKELENQCSSLAKEKEELEHKLQSVKASEAKNKIAEQRRLRLKELEQQMSQLKKKMAEQTKMIKLKAQSDKQLVKYSKEIQDIKAARVKLLKQLKEDADQFRKFRQAKEREVLQLKAKERKRQADMARLERCVTNHQSIARRKAEEAAVAHKRLKEALMRQKQVQSDRVRRQKASDTSSYSQRVHRWMKEELDMCVAIEEARRQLETLKANRKELAAELSKAKAFLDDSSQWGPPTKRRQSSTNVSINTSTIRHDAEKKVADLEGEMELVSTRIQALNEKLAESSDHPPLIESIMGQVSSVAEGRTAVKEAMTKLINCEVKKNKAIQDMEDAKAELAELEKFNVANTDEQKKKDEEAEKNITELQRECDLKVLYLMDQLNKKPTDYENLAGLDEKTKQKLKFQESEIKRCLRLEEDLNAKQAECDRLQSELTRQMYKQKVFSKNEGDATEFSFFSPALTTRLNPNSPLLEPVLEPRQAKLNKPAYKFLEDSSDEVDENDVSDSKDSDWEAGKTPHLATKHFPRVIKKTARSQRRNANMQENPEIDDQPATTKRTGKRKTLTQ